MLLTISALKNDLFSDSCSKHSNEVIAIIMCHKPSPISALSNGISYVMVFPAVFENTEQNATSVKALGFYIYSRFSQGSSGWPFLPHTACHCRL